jgi:uncharacterized protein (DUF1697 family)
MAPFISMLRGINVGGQNKIKMPELKALYESLGLAGVATYVQSGNVVFDSDATDAAQVAQMIETGINRALGLSVQVLIRDAGRFRQIIAANPFLTRRNEDPTKLHVTFLAATPSTEAITALGSTRDHAGEFIPAGREIYLFCPNGYGKTKFSNTFFEKKLDMAATTRNWNTVTALYRLAGQSR